MPTEKEIARRALDLVNDTQLGILMTCDERGYPHGRWMHLLPTAGLHRLYSLTAAGSRKLRHIADHPEVSWIVTGDHDQTVFLKGRATINPDSMSIQELWDRLGPAMQQNSVGPLSDEDRLELVALETVVEGAEVISPPLGVCVPRAIDLGV